MAQVTPFDPNSVYTYESVSFHHTGPQEDPAFQSDVSTGIRQAQDAGQDGKFSQDELKTLGNQLAKIANYVPDDDTNTRADMLKAAANLQSGNADAYTQYTLSLVRVKTDGQLNNYIATLHDALRSGSVES
jgi:hypothetical protein